MESKKALLSVRDLEVKFRVRGRILTAIRGISLDIYENESIAIVGESGSGKSGFTKTFAGMLDANGFISRGSVVFDDPELAETKASKSAGSRVISDALRTLNQYSPLEYGAETYKKIQKLKDEKTAKETLSAEEEERIDGELASLNFQRTEAGNRKQTYDPKTEKEEIRKTEQEIEQLTARIKEVEKEKEELIRKHREAAAKDTAWQEAWQKQLSGLEAVYREETSKPLSDAMKARNEVIAKEIWLSVSRLPRRKRGKAEKELLEACRKAMELGVSLEDAEERARILGDVTLYVRYLDEEGDILRGHCAFNLAKVTAPGDWSRIRGKKIATVFQDPMTSLNPIITIGRQIMSIILKHQNCSEAEARSRALILMKKVGIPNAEKRFDDYPFQYSGGMRQRIVIAIALSCQPKILICDEPTTALDVTIQAQILKLLKDLQKEFNYTIVFITHDLGVVANMADRVAVMYAGQIVELGTVEEVFYDPRHPYTWALLSSLPQLAQKNTELYSITGTPPSLYNKIVGDPFAPRNPYCMKIDTLKEPPMFQITQTHYAKTWLEDPRSPRVQKPEIIENIHEKLMEAYHI